MEIASVLILILLIGGIDTSPIIPEKEAKQLLRTRREDRPRKAGYPDEPMMVGTISCGIYEMRDAGFNIRTAMDCRSLEDIDKEYLLHLQQLEQRSEEQFLEHWLNPYCLPHCNRDLVSPV